MRGMSTEELTKGSDIVVTGMVEDVKARWSMDGKVIFTTAKIKITGIVRGRTGQTVLDVEYRGGEVGDRGYRISDNPVLKKGEKVLLFLKPATSFMGGSAHQVIGRAQGKYTVGDDGITRKQGFSIMIGGEVIDNNIPVDELIEKIRRVK
jgi:hypothetical protein